ncbi:MAG: MlaD family protein [bacterium]
MGKKVNPAVIGAFVIGAVALAVLAVIVFGSGQIFKKTRPYVMYFPGSVNGLSVGSPVKFRGVQLGQVTNIELVFDAKEDNRVPRIPVYVELDPAKIIVEGTEMKLSDPKMLQAFIAHGLRAQLQSQSLVTGLLFVQLDFFPDSEVRFVNPPGSWPSELPTISSTLEQAQTAAREIIDELRSIKVGPVIQQISETLQSINDLVNSPAVKDTLNALPATVKSLDRTIDSARQLLTKIDGEVSPIGKQLDATLAQTKQTMAAVEKTAGSATTLIEPGSPLDYQLRKALQDLGSAARSIQQFADYLERNPSALIYGKPAPEGAPK